MNSKQEKIIDKAPQHIAIIMDGNGRWAQQKGKARIFGHRNAVGAVRNAVEAAGELGVKFLTLYAFSTENWNRPKTEINALMKLLVNAIHKEIKSLNKNGVRLMAIGNLESLPKKCYEELHSAMEKTSGNEKLTVVLALSYSSRQEIVNAAKNISGDILNGKLKPEDVDENLYSSYLETADFPDPELMIRTSGEYRVSNFLMWQLAYAELYFLDKFWPDFKKEDLFKAVYDFQKRERRFGLTGEQLKLENE